MQDSNFYDEETGEKFSITNFKLVHRDGQWINVDRLGNQIKNPENGNVLKDIPKEGIPSFNKSNDKAQLQKMLKKRSSDHFKKEIEEVKHEKNKQLKNSFKPE